MDIYSKLIEIVYFFPLIAMLYFFKLTKLFGFFLVLFMCILSKRMFSFPDFSLTSPCILHKPTYVNWEELKSAGLKTGCPLTIPRFMDGFGWRITWARGVEALVCCRVCLAMQTYDVQAKPVCFLTPTLSRQHQQLDIPPYKVSECTNFTNTHLQKVRSSRGRWVL